MNNKKVVIILVLAALMTVPITATYSNFGMNMGITYGSVVSDTEDDIHLIGISLQPDLAFGNWGVGLDVTLNFEAAGGDGFLKFYSEDWIPEFGVNDSIWVKTKTAAALYLPIFRYVRYGHKGDKLYGQIGMFDSYTLGTGVFLDRYTNTRFVPTKRLTGLLLDIDGRLFNFPYIGLEMMTANITEFDVLGARLYSRPLSFLDIPIISNIQIGGSYTADRNPALHSDDDTFTPDTVQMFGADMVLPLIPLSLFSMDLFTDFAFQSRPDTVTDDMAKAFRTGARGKIGGLINYVADFTIPYNGYVPYYFDKTYDQNRQEKYEDAGLDFSADGVYYVRGSAGFDLFRENLAFDLMISAEVDSNDFSINKPSMTAFLSVGEDLVPFFFFDAIYTKNFLDGEVDDMSDFLDGILSPNRNSIIEVSANVKYKLFLTKLGITVAYDENSDSTVTTTIAGGIQLDGLFGFLQ